MAGVAARSETVRIRGCRALAGEDDRRAASRNLLAATARPPGGLEHPRRVARSRLRLLASALRGAPSARDDDAWAEELSALPLGYWSPLHGIGPCAP